MVSLSPAQLIAISKLENGKILNGGGGTGKSRTSLAYFLIKVVEAPFPINDNGTRAGFPKHPVPLYIITTPKKRDDKEWELELGIFGMGVPDGGILQRPIVVDSWNNIKRYVDVKDAFFIFDEQRLVGSGAWVKSFYKIAKNNRWILLSATPGDDWGDYIPVFVANGWYKNKTDFIARHGVYDIYANFPKIARWVDTERLEILRRRVLVPIDHSRHTVRHVETVVCGYDKEAYTALRASRWLVEEDRPAKDASELWRALRRATTDHSQRTMALDGLLQRHPKLIVFYNFNHERDALISWVTEKGYIWGEWSGHAHHPVPDTESWLYFVQYTAGAEGWNCTTTNAMAFYSLTYSYKQYEQAMCRIDRMNTPFIDLYFYILRADSQEDRRIWRALSTKRDFNIRGALRELQKGYELA